MSTGMFIIFLSALVFSINNFNFTIEMIPTLDIKINPENATLILSAIASFIYVKFCYDSKGKYRKLSFISVSLFYLSGALPFLISESEYYGFGWFFIITSILSGVIGLILSSIFFLTSIALLTRRSDEKMKTKGLERYSPASVAYIRSSILLTAIFIILLSCLLILSKIFEKDFNNLSFIFLFIPVVIMNFDYIEHLIRLALKIKPRPKTLSEINGIIKTQDVHEMHYQFSGITPLQTNFHTPDLFKLSYNGDISKVEEELNSGSNPNESDARGWSPLMIASAEGHFDIVNLLLEYGADPNKKNYQERTALSYACLHNRIDIVNILLKNNADPNFSIVGEDDSPLIISVKKAGLGVVEALIENGADQFRLDRDGLTALQVAEKNNKVEIAKFLRKRSLLHSKNADGSVLDSDWLK